MLNCYGNRIIFAVIEAQKNSIITNYKDSIEKNQFDMPVYKLIFYFYSWERIRGSIMGREIHILIYGKISIFYLYKIFQCSWCSAFDAM
jgi:hypothetical protein